MRRLFFALTSAAIIWTSIASPEPTLLPRDFDANGWTPAPTAPPQLVRRHDSSDLTCAYVNGASSESLTCSTGMCGYDFTSSWFGCCNSTTMVSGTAEPYKCPVITNCVDYTALDQCTSDSDCATNTAISKCTDTASPYCAIYALLDFESMYHYMCRDTSFTSGAYLEPTETSDSGEAALTSDGSAESTAVQSAQNSLAEPTSSETTSTGTSLVPVSSNSTIVSSTSSKVVPSAGRVWLATSFGAIMAVLLNSGQILLM